MALATVTGYAQASIQYSGANPGPASALSLPGPQAGPFTLSLKQAVTTGGNTANGANEVFSLITTLSASASATLNMMAQSDILGLTASLVRMKSFLIANLSVVQDATAGGNSSAVVVGNAASNQLTLTMGGTNPTYSLLNGDFWLSGTGNPNGITVNAGNSAIKLANQDSGNSAGVLLIPFGATT